MSTSVTGKGKWRLRRLGLAGLILGGGWLTVFAYSVHAALPFNPIRLPFETWAHVRMWIPEGWAFFTRDPREERILLFKRAKNNQWGSAMGGPNAKVSNAFGLNRASRAQMTEAASILNKFKNSDYSDCRDLPLSCLARIQTAASAANTSPNPSLCGDIGVAMQKPVPWAWWASGHAVTMPSRILRVSVACP